MYFRRSLVVYELQLSINGTLYVCMKLIFDLAVLNIYRKLHRQMAAMVINYSFSFTDVSLQALVSGSSCFKVECSITFKIQQLCLRLSAGTKTYFL